MQELFSENFKSELAGLLVDNTPIAYIILDDEFRIHYINDYFLKLRKLSLESTIGEICYNISNRGIPCAHCAVAKALKTGQKAMVVRKDVLPDGSVRFIDDYAIPLQKLNPDDPQYTLEIMVDRSKEMLSREQKNKDFNEIVSLFSNILEAKDQYTATHSQQVRKISLKLALAMHLSPEEIFDISIAASLHDIGKVNIPDSIINKPGRLTDEEFTTIKNHPTGSYEMIQDLSSFSYIKQVVRHHHEKFDGTGYPKGLSGKDIPLGARIVSVADTYDAMTSTRSYRKALSHEYAIAEIQKWSGTQFDPDIVSLLDQIDFDFSCEPSLVEKATHAPVERVIPQEDYTAMEQCADTCKKSAHTAQNSLKNSNLLPAEKNRLLNEVFANTPCGYVLMDTKRNVLFASKYFLDFMGLAEDEVVGRKCYQAGGAGSSPCAPCAIEEALKSRKVEYMRQEQNTKKGRKIFDLFGMPLVNASGEIHYIIEVIIDRTEEITLEREREKDFAALIETLKKLLQSQEHENIAPKLLAKINSLKDRLDTLLAQSARS